MDTQQQQQQGAMEYAVVDKSKKKQKGNKQQNVSCSYYIRMRILYHIHTGMHLYACTLCKYLIMSTCSSV